jgi:ribonucleotide monophosphatase NagD (HAD superfamily)
MARREGLMPVREDAQFVILGRDPGWDYRRLTLLGNEVRRGATLITTNPGLTHPDGEHRVIPETGSLLAALVAGSGIDLTRSGDLNLNRPRFRNARRHRDGCKEL